ncbi:uncharacterized protein LOC144736314 isoform X3 [Lampetra planeri]
MLKPVVAKLTGKCVVLASASPRRRDILTNIGLKFEVVPSWYSEDLSKAEYPAPYAYATETAVRKALEVAKRMHERHQKTPDLVIGADTVVAQRARAQRVHRRGVGRVLRSRGQVTDQRSAVSRGDASEVCRALGRVALGVHRQRRTNGQGGRIWNPGAGRDVRGEYPRRFPQCGGVAPPPRLPQVRRALQLRSCHTLSWRSCWACLCRAQWRCRVWGRRQKGDGPANASSGASRGNGYVYLSTDPADVGSSSCCLPAYGAPLSLSPFCMKLKSIQFS